MSIKGDMVFGLIAKFPALKLDQKLAAEIVKDVLETAAEPAFASRYANSLPVPYTAVNHDQLMLMYWDVIRFLEGSI